jgi:isoaspartyl peptidase/L-asparaginase-like protein (Ntn-hydrolase superfamily)
MRVMWATRLALLLAAMCACRGARSQDREPPPLPWTPAVVAHCGSGTPPGEAGGCKAGVDAALAVLERGGDPLDAAVAGVAVLEDDPRYNAGTGSAVRLDGTTVQMDAAVMDSAGRFGAVAVIEDVRNPVKVARAVVDTPHRLLAGDGATAFARARGFPAFDVRTPEATAEAATLRADLESGRDVPRSWQGFDWKGAYNYGPGSDTVGVAVRGADGTFAVALSTGGWTIVLRGRVGDVPVPGAGLFAGPAGAVAATGRGETIIDVALARTVYGWMAEGMSAQEAVRRGVELLGGDGGLVAIGPHDLAGDAGKPMGWCGRELGAPAWTGTLPP